SSRLLSRYDKSDESPVSKILFKPRGLGRPPHRAGITFMTLRRRSPGLLAEIDRLPASAWRTVTLDLPSRKYRTPTVFEQKVRLLGRSYRQFFIRDLGHDEPTILLSNDARSTARNLIARYAKRMLIENA